MDALRQWLENLDLGQYAQTFADNDIDLEVLPELSDQDLKELGLSLGHRRKLLKAVAALAGAPAPAPRSEAERRQLTVMFCDLVGSTALSARLDPEDMREVIRSYQDTCAGILARFEGFVAKFMGDGVLAYFGWPRAHEDEAERAVRAGLALTEAMAGLSTPAGEPLAVRVGIATGMVVVGDLIGEGAAQEQAVVGDTPNLAARLQGVADPGQVVIGGATRRLLGQRFDLIDLGPQALKGLTAPVEAFAVQGERAAQSRFETGRGQVLPMVGRDQELELLLDRWRQAKGGEGQGVLLIGEPGIGKSRITRALLDALADEAHTRVRYQCSPYHVDSALWPVTQQLTYAAGLVLGDSLEAKLDKLEALLDRADGRESAPLIADLLRLDAAPRYGALDLTPQAQRARTLDALVAQVVGLAARQPVLMILEDVHWIDPTTLELFERCFDRIVRAPVLIVLTSRPDNEPQLARRPDVTRLPLNRLGHAGVEAIVARVGGDHLPGATIDAIIARTDGVPLFVEELTKAVLESGELSVPASIHDSLMARLDRVAEAKEIAQAASCIGRTVDYPLLVSVVGQQETELRASLDQLVGSGLVFRRGNPPEATYIFKHALVQEAAHASLLRARRQQLHARIAQALEDRVRQGAASEPEELARHYTEAGLPEQAIPHLLEAGARAAARSASPEAIGHLSRALDLLSALPEGDVRNRQELRLRLALAVPLIAVHGFGSDEVEACARRAKGLSDVLGSEDDRFTAVRALWNSSLMRRPVAETLALSAELQQLAETTDDRAQRAVAHRSRGYSLFFACRLDEAQDELSKGIAFADSVTDPVRFRAYGEHPAMVCRVYSGWTLALRGEVDRALAVAEDGVATARRLSNVHTLAWALSCFALVLAFRRDLQATRATAGEAMELARTHPMPQWLAWSTFFQGWATAELEDPDAGIAAMEDGLARWHATGAVLSTTLLHGLFAAALHKLGDQRRGQAELQVALDHLSGFGERFMEAELHRTEATFLSGEGAAPDRVESALRTAMERAGAQGATLWQLRAATDLARLCRDQGRRAQARDLLAPIYGRLTEGFKAADLIDARALLEELDADAARI